MEVIDIMTKGLLMLDFSLRNGTAGEPAETASDGAATTADDAPGAEEAAPALTLLGSDDAAVCADGVCAL
ncbi:hypothetical protein ACH4S9_26155 [Streptomyces sp. NPDC021225]|uniref:hypothetical protein n=1 Tax=Streptomyces sp. NPDC021225 TaxID=3365121 RepID=UPI00378E6DA1